MLGALDDAVDAVAGLDPLTLDTSEIGEWAVALHARRARLDASATHAVGAFDALGDIENARSSAAWLAYRCRLARWLTQRYLAYARALRRMPEVDAAFSRGELGSSTCGCSRRRTG